MRKEFGKDYYKQFIPRQGIPEAIYKFSSINDDLKKSLSRNYLWFSKPSEFNDPFDCYNELVVYKPSEEDIYNLFMSRLKGNRNQRRAEALKHMKSPHLVTNAYKNILPSYIEQMGVCCFTLNHENTLMWSHYANNHKGICLIFNPLIDLRTFLIAEVNYSEDFKPYNYFGEKEDALFRMVITKSKDWEYEKEVRIILTDKNGPLPFPKAALVGIIFGCRVSNENIKDVKKIVTEAGYANLKYKQAVSEKDTFKLSFMELE